MSNDGGKVALIEQVLVDKLLALKVFRTVDVWKWQTGPDEGGKENWLPFTPFAFVSYEPPDADRQGGDLVQKLRFAVTIGVESKEAGICRCGDTKHIGTSRFRDYVIDALEDCDPGNGCDPLHYQYDTEAVSSRFRHAINMIFECNLITLKT